MNELNGIVAKHTGGLFSKVDHSELSHGICHLGHLFATTFAVPKPLLFKRRLPDALCEEEWIECLEESRGKGLTFGQSQQILKIRIVFKAGGALGSDNSKSNGKVGSKHQKGEELAQFE